MPTYDYECDACGHKFEEFQSMMDKLLKIPKKELDEKIVQEYRKPKPQTN